MHPCASHRLRVAALLLATACSQDAQGGAPGAGGAGARSGGPSITLAATDVGVVRRGPIEQGTPVTGDLRPIETVQVRARLEGDLLGVYVREGERVARGKLLAQFEASEEEGDRRSAEADRESARSELSTAEWSLEQAEELFRAGAVAERDLRAARQAVTVARARVAAADARLRASASVVTDTRVVAPTDGIVEQRLVESGERVSRGATLFTIVRGDVLELAAALSSRAASDVRVGQLVHFTADGRRFDGRVARVSPTIDPATRAVTVYVQVPNAGGAIKGGTFASGRVVGRTIPDALLVPAAAIRQSGDGTQPLVYRIVGEKLEQRGVRLGVVDDAQGMAEVLEGLDAGDRVVIGNVGTLGQGMRVIVAGGDEGRGRGASPPASSGAAARP